jgi:hypothetical protein
MWDAYPDAYRDGHREHCYRRAGPGRAPAWDLGQGGKDPGKWDAQERETTGGEWVRLAAVVEVARQTPG